MTAEDAAGLRAQLDGRLVGLDDRNGIARSDRLTRLLQPLRKEGLLHRHPRGWHEDLFHDSPYSFSPTDRLSEPARHAVLTRPRDHDAPITDTTGGDPLDGVPDSPGREPPDRAHRVRRHVRREDGVRSSEQGG